MLSAKFQARIRAGPGLGQVALMTRLPSCSLRHLLQFKARAEAYLFQQLTLAPLHPYQGRGHCTIPLVPAWSTYSLPWQGGKGWKFGGACNCSQLGEGLDLAINTQKAAKRLQLWPRGCGGLGLGWSGVVLSSLLSPASWPQGGRRQHISETDKICS